MLPSRSCCRIQNVFAIGSNGYSCIYKRFGSNLAMNKLGLANMQMALNNSERSKRLRSKNAGSLSPHYAPKVNLDIQKALRSATNSNQVLQLIRSNASEIADASIYGKAMLKCNKLRGHECTMSLWNDLLKSGLKLDVVQFTIFFNGLCAIDKPEIIQKHFKLMIQKYELQPTLLTISVLIKSCRRRGLHEVAGKYWKLLEIYKIKPNEILYTEIISVYSKALQKDKAIKMFKEYQKTIRNKELKYHFPTFAAYLTVFTRCGDLQGMHGVVEMIKTNGGYMNEIIYGDMMRGYITADEFEQTLETFDDMIRNEIKPTFTHLFLKIVALFRSMDRDKDILTKAEKIQLHKDIEYELNNELSFYGVKMNPLLANVYLGATLVAYYDVDPMHIVKVFRRLCERKLMVYLRTNKDGTISIDLSGFHFAEAQFIMRYILAFEIDQIVKRNQEKGCEIVSVFVGSNAHVTVNNIKKNDLKCLVMNDLLNYDPRIQAVRSEEDEQRIDIHMDQLLTYVNNMNTSGTNDAFDKLQMQTSHVYDWYCRLYKHTVNR
eukprot:1025983_1